MRRFVKPIQSLDLLQPLWVHALRAPVDRTALGPNSPAGPRLCQVLVHRPARHELDHHEGQQQDAEQRRDHQEQALEDVNPHGQLVFPKGLWMV